MPRTDRSAAILTGMLIAALYVILLVGFTRESTMRQESTMRRDAASRTDGSGGRFCRVEPPLCAALFPDAGERQGCLTSLDAVRRFASEPMVPLTLEGLRRAMREEP